MVEHLLTVADEMFGIEHRQLYVVFAEHVQQALFTFDLGQLAKVAVMLEQIEGRRPVCLQPAPLEVRRSWSGPHGRLPPHHR